jgi:hypothetical protein
MTDAGTDDDLLLLFIMSCSLVVDNRLETATTHRFSVVPVEIIPWRICH